MIVGVIRETSPGERRVALTPAALKPLHDCRAEVLIERGAGEPAGCADDAYAAAGARLVDRAEVFERADVLAQVQAPSAHRGDPAGDLEALRPGLIVIGCCEPLTAHEPVRRLAETGVQSFALELIPRITRAQSMDVLSSQATVSGYEASLLGAMHCMRLFPMLMTAAGTVPASRALIIGAGVAGLQAIATCRRLGAIVSAYDIRPAVKEQVESLGATFVELDLDPAGSEDKGGYARAMDDTFYQKQREALTAAVGASDVVITTAAVPGRKSPVLVTEEMVKGMRRGSVIIDLAAERGGNCELTEADQTVETGGVTILGPTNLPSAAPFTSSGLYAKNVVTFLRHLLNDEHELAPDLEDEIVQATRLTANGEIVQARVREIFGLSSAAPVGADEASASNEEPEGSDA